MESLSNSSSQFSSYNSFEQARMNSYLNNMLQFDGNLTDIDDEMASIEKRFETFKSWPESSPLKPMDLVNAGFYYTGFGDEVRCFSCDLQLKEWKHGDSPFNEHRRRKRDCNFVMEYERERLGVTCNPEPASEPVTGSVVGNRLEGYSRNPYLPYSNQLNYETPTNRAIIRDTNYQPEYIHPQQQQQHYFPVYQEPYQNNQQASHITSSSGVFVTSQYPHSNRPVLQTPEEFTVRPNYPNIPGGEQSSTVRMPSVNYTGMVRPNYPNMPGAEQSPMMRTPSINYTGIVRPNYQNMSGAEQTSTVRMPSVNYTGMVRPNYYPNMPGAEQSSLTRMPSINYTSGISTGYQESIPTSFDRYSTRYDDIPPTSFDRYSMRYDDIPVLNPVLQHVPNVQVRTEDTHHTTSQTDLQNNHHRLATFIDWPEDCPVHPWELAAAGFFYMGTGDNVKCYKCKVALRNWEPDDTPWEEHKRWSPDCPLVKEHEGHARTPVEDQEQITETSHQRMPSAASNVPKAPRQEQKTSTYMQPEPSQQPQYSQVQHQQQQHPLQHQQQHMQQQYPLQQHQQQQIQHKLQQQQHPQQRPQHLPGLSKIPLAQSESQCGYEMWGRAPNQDDIENRHPYYSPSTENAAFSTQITATTRVFNTSSSYATPGVAVSTQGCNNGSLDDRDFTRVIEMGFSREDIDNAIARQTERTGTGFAKLDDLMQALLDADNRTTSRSPPPSTAISEPHQIAETQTSATEGLRTQLASAQSFSFEPSTLSVKRTLKRSNSAPPGAQGSAGSTSEQSTRDLDNMQEERLICKICMDAEVGVVFLPCGHISCCPGCASGLDLCPMCRKPIRQRVRTFLS